MKGLTALLLWTNMSTMGPLPEIGYIKKLFKQSIGNPIDSKRNSFHKDFSQTTEYLYSKLLRIFIIFAFISIRSISYFCKSG